MDLETENRIAAILMREAAEMRRQAEKEGVLAYLRQSNARGRPNSRFLTATVLGVQQANRAVEVNEMWRVRQKELELDDRLKGRLKEESSSGQSQRDTRNHRRTTSKRHDGKESDASALCSSSKRGIQDCCSQDDESLRDEEMEEFLHSRAKRGRGAVGSRMDETGPYLPASQDSMGKTFESPVTGGRERWEHRGVLGSDKPSSLESFVSSEEESHHRQKKSKKVGSGSSSKQHSKKHRSKKKSNDRKKKKREERRSKHHK